MEVPSPISGVLGSITVKEGQTVNVGSLLGTVDNSLAQGGDKAKVKEINNYSPPKKDEENIKPKIFAEEKKSKPKKIKKEISEELKLILDDEEPLILEQEHKEQVFQK